MARVGKLARGHSKASKLSGSGGAKPQQGDKSRLHVFASDQWTVRETFRKYLDESDLSLILTPLKQVSEFVTIPKDTLEETLTAALINSKAVSTNGEQGGSLPSASARARASHCAALSHTHTLAHALHPPLSPSLPGLPALPGAA